MIEGLLKTYPRRWGRASVPAVRGVSLNVDTGEAFGFIGPNGAGKSSLIRIVMGLSAATEGKVTIFGVSADRSEARRGVGYVPENAYLYDYLTPLEILLMGLKLHGAKFEKPEQHCLNWLDRLGLLSVARTTIRSFSKGMVQRVAIAQALALQPRLLILDEPLSGLDPVGRYDVVELLSEYKRDGGTLFFTSHVLHDVERLADRFALIHQGEIVSVRSPADLVHGEDIVRVRSIGAGPVPGMRQDGQEGWVGDVTRTELWEYLNRLRDANHILVEVRPALSLETAFMKAIGRA